MIPVFIDAVMVSRTASHVSPSPLARLSHTPSSISQRLGTHSFVDIAIPPRYVSASTDRNGHTPPCQLYTVQIKYLPPRQRKIHRLVPTRLGWRTSAACDRYLAGESRKSMLFVVILLLLFSIRRRRLRPGNTEHAQSRRSSPDEGPPLPSLMRPPDLHAGSRGLRVLPGERVLMQYLYGDTRHPSLGGHRPATKL